VNVPDAMLAARACVQWPMAAVSVARLVTTTVIGHNRHLVILKLRHKYAVQSCVFGCCTSACSHVTAHHAFKQHAKQSLYLRCNILKCLCEWPHLFSCSDSPARLLAFMPCSENLCLSGPHPIMRCSACSPWYPLQLCHTSSRHLHGTTQ
jgi:hypothetical protein